MRRVDRILFEPAGCFAEFDGQAEACPALYEDVIPALSELKTMGLALAIATSLPGGAVAGFLERHSLGGYFDGVWPGENAAAPLERALAGTPPEHAMFLTGTAEGIELAKSVGVNAILMMNDPDEAQRLALRNPAGGIVSLHELPDFVRLWTRRA